MSADWKQEIKEQREEKEEYFGEDHRSPIPREEEFEGLSYYPVDGDYRFRVELH